MERSHSLSNLRPCWGTNCAGQAVDGFCLEQRTVFQFYGLPLAQLSGLLFGPEIKTGKNNIRKSWKNSKIAHKGNVVRAHFEKKARDSCDGFWIGSVLGARNPRTFASRVPRKLNGNFSARNCVWFWGRVYTPRSEGRWQKICCLKTSTCQCRFRCQKRWIDVRRTSAAKIPNWSVAFERSWSGRRQWSVKKW